MGVPIGDTVRARSDSAAESMTKLIRWLGDKCARRPCVVTFVMVFVSLLGASGLHVAEFETDGYKLWVPTESFAYKRWTETAELFGQGGRGGTMLFTADDMLSVPALTDVLTARESACSLARVLCFIDRVAPARHKAARASRNHARLRAAAPNPVIPGPSALLRAFRADLAPARVSRGNRLVWRADHAITSRDGLDEVDPNSGETTGEKVFFEDVCATYGPDDEYCDFWNPMAAFNYNQTVLDQVAAAGLVLPYIDALKTIMPLEAILGDVQYDPDTGIIASAAAMLVSWRLDPSRAKTQDPALVCEARACVDVLVSNLRATMPSHAACLSLGWGPGGGCGRGLGGVGWSITGVRGRRFAILRRRREEVAEERPFALLHAAFGR